MGVIRRLGVSGAVAGALCVAGFAAVADETVPFVDGTMWKKSAPVLKRTYLVGISNLLVAEYLYQKDWGPPPDNQTSIQRFYEGLDNDTLDAAVERIDAWYEANPNQLDTTVLEVIWVQLVEPNLPASRRYHD